ncbi:MAG: glycosyltransferase [Magnetococcales bacterium]|nr:glycosyltransferase [Magnetococcales bacterium]
MNILFLCDQLAVGGAERQLLLLARGLKNKGHGVQVAVFKSGGPLEPELAEAGIPLIDLQKNNPVSHIFRLITLLRQSPPDVLHSYLPMANLVAALATLFTPRVRLVWGVRASNLDLSYLGWHDRRSRVVIQLNRLFCRLADLIIANSQAGADHHRRLGYPWARLSVIPNGIDTRRFQFDPQAREGIRRAWGVGEGVALIGVVGRLDPMKGLPTFLRAGAMLTRKMPQVQLVVVGDGPVEYRQDLQRQGEALGLGEALTWAGGRSDTPGVYSALDVLVSASWFGEGFSNVIGEGMAVGLPCVVTDVGDAGVIVGEAGIIVPPRDAEAMVGALERVLGLSGEERQQMGEMARARMAEQFSTDLLVARSEVELVGLCA